MSSVHTLHGMWIRSVVSFRYSTKYLLECRWKVSRIPNNLFVYFFFRLAMWKSQLHDYNRIPGVKNPFNGQVFVRNFVWLNENIWILDKILQLTRKKGETVWLQCDVEDYLRPFIEWRWNGKNIQDATLNNFLLTKDQSSFRLSQ